MNLAIDFDTTLLSPDAMPQLFARPVVAKQQLRPYQVECVERVFWAFDNGWWRVMFVLPTGCGKTTTFAELIEQMFARYNRPALVLAHRDELLTQAADRVRGHCGLRIGVEQAEQKASQSSQVVVASVQTIGRPGSSRLQWLADIGPSVIIIDECHHGVDGGGYGRVVERFGGFDERTYVVGCTATPKRLDRRALCGDRYTDEKTGLMAGPVFQQEVFPHDGFKFGIREAIQQGYLCDIVGYRVVSGIDLSAVKRSGGDYNHDQLDKAVNVEARTKRAIDHWLEKGSDRKTIAFCTSVDHAHNVTEAFRKLGYRAETIWGDMPPDDRKATLRRLRAGETQIVTNYEVLTEGFDDPSISCILHMRPTESWTLYVQMTGRGLRPWPGKLNCLVLDVVDNTANLSLATVPAILDLPPDLDLKGNSLEAAAKKLDELGPKIAQFKGAVGLSFEDLDTLLHEVDMLASTEVPAEIDEHARYPWMRDQTCDHGYVLDTQNGIARLRSDKGGRWHLQLADKGGAVKFTQKAYSCHLDDAVERADYWVEHEWPSVRILARTRKWRAKKPTTKQVKLLLQLKYSPALVSTLTAGQAGQLITKKFAEHKRRAADRKAEKAAKT